MQTPIAISRQRFSILVAVMAMIAPFSIDTYIPAMQAMALDLRTDQVTILQTLTVYFFAFATMTLWHGSISDSVGRRPVILVSLAIYVLISLVCACAPNAPTLVAARLVQGLVAGVGVVVGRAIIRDAFSGADAQRMQSQVTIVFGIAPAIAPIIGGYLLAFLGWRSIFVFMSLVAALTLAAVYYVLPETLPKEKRQPLNAKSLLHNYRRIFFTARFQLLAGAAALMFAGLFLYVAAAPVYILHHLKLSETQFAWLFMPFIFGLMTSAVISGRVAGRLPMLKQMAIGLILAVFFSIINVIYAMKFAPQVPWSAIPLFGFGMGLGLFSSAASLRMLDFFPTLRGTCSSLMSFTQTMLAAIITGVVAPAVSHTFLSLTLTALALTVIAAIAWCVFYRWFRTAQPLLD